jgi:hypothetical protein
MEKEKKKTGGKMAEAVRLKEQEAEKKEINILKQEKGEKYEVEKR